jgi:hypothetical protein
MGIEVAADRKATWVALAGVRRSGHVIVKLLDPLPGAGVAPTLARAWDDLPSPTVGIDPRSPSATLVEPLQAEGVPLRLADARGIAVAHGVLLDLLAVGRLRVRGHGALDQAARLAATRRLAGADAVERYGGADLAPLLAAELAVWALGNLESVGGLRPDQVTVASVGQSVQREERQMQNFPSVPGDNAKQAVYAHVAPEVGPTGTEAQVGVKEDYLAEVHAAIAQPGVHRQAGGAK